MKGGPCQINQSSILKHLQLPHMDISMKGCGWVLDGGHRSQKTSLYEACDSCEVEIETTCTRATNTEVITERTESHTDTLTLQKGKGRAAQDGKLFPEIKYAL